LGSICRTLVDADEPPAVEKPHEPPKPSGRERFGRVVCIICGRVGRFVAARIRRE
jgi:hypothetical protein